MEASDAGMEARAGRGAGAAVDAADADAALELPLAAPAAVEEASMPPADSEPAGAELRLPGLVNECVAAGAAAAAAPAGGAGEGSTARQDTRACRNPSVLMPGRQTGVQPSLLRKAALLCAHTVSSDASLGRSAYSLLRVCAQLTTALPASSSACVTPGQRCEAEARAAVTRARTAGGSVRTGMASSQTEGKRLAQRMVFRNCGRVPASSMRTSRPGRSLSRCSMRPDSAMISTPCRQRSCSRSAWTDSPVRATATSTNGPRRENTSVVLPATMTLQSAFETRGHKKWR